MKNVLKVLAIGLFLAGMVFAKGEQPPGEPPFGAVVHGDAKGTKLNGALFAEFINCALNAQFALICDAEVVLRLRKSGSGQLELLFGTIPGVEPANVPATQAAIVNGMTPAITGAFGGSTVKVKNITEFIYDATESVFLTDVQLAVN